MKRDWIIVTASVTILITLSYLTLLPSIAPKGYDELMTAKVHFHHLTATMESASSMLNSNTTLQVDEHLLRWRKDVSRFGENEIDVYRQGPLPEWFCGSTLHRVHILDKGAVNSKGFPVMWTLHRVGRNTKCLFVDVNNDVKVESSKEFERRLSMHALSPSPENEFVYIKNPKSAITQNDDTQQ